MSTRLSPLRRAARFAPAMLTAALLAACASTRGLAPETRPLDADSLQGVRTLKSATPADFPRQDWWRAFGDPQLDALVDEALAGTPTLDAADARVRQAIAQAGLADAARKPTLGAGAQYTAIEIPTTIAPEPLGGEFTGAVLLTLNFKYTADFWGGHRARWQAAVGQTRATEVEAQAARVTLASNVVRAYIALAQAEQAQDVALAEKARASKLLDLGQQRVKAGLDNQMQIRQAQSTVASAEQQAQAARQQADVARTALAALLGKGPDRGLSITAPKLLDLPAPGVPNVVPSELLGHRPDVVAARWRVESAQQGIKSSKADFYPTVNLTALVGLASAGLSDLFTSDALLINGGPAISMPIFDGGRLRNALAKSDADYDLAVANYNGTLVSGLREVADALQTARSLDAQIASTRQARDAAQSAWSLATARYRAGLSNQLDVLAAQRPLLVFDQQLALLRAQRLSAIAELDRALGGGLTLAAPPASTESNLASSPLSNTP